jgi:uncharacterized protein with GYD domain
LLFAKAFIMLTRLNPDAVRPPKGLETLERDAMKHVREECPKVEWLNSYAVLGPYDYLDIFVAGDIETAAKVSTPIRTFGYAQTDIWSATEWDRLSGRFRVRPAHDPCQPAKAAKAMRLQWVTAA